jgi:putative tricarboxylic transport membrane protein
MFDGLPAALQIITDLETLLILLAGTTFGFIVAILPGISGVNAMALLLPVTFGMSYYQAMAFLVGIMAAGGFGGSITSILLNVPGDGTNAATTLDGYPMSRQGRAGQAIGASATASALGALFGVLVLVASLPIIRRVILSFGPAEMFAMSVAGIALIATVSKGNMIRGLIAGLVGMCVGLIGMNLPLGGTRFTFDTRVLYDGVPLIPAVIGFFAIPEIYKLLVTNRPISESGQVVKGGVLEGAREVLRRPGLLIRSSFIGTAIGFLPGVGGSVAPWIAYFAAKNSSKHPETFGTGEIEGVIAPEASNDSKDGGALMPLLALGIPGSLTTALLLSAFLLHGVTPGQRLFQNDMALIWVMIIAIVIANFTTSAVGMAFSNILIKLTLIPATLIAPIVLSLAMVGGYASVARFDGMLFTLGAGLLGIVMVKGDFPRPPLLVGFILLPIVERNFHQSLQINRGSYVFLLRPITLTILVVTVFGIFFPVVRARLKSSDRRKAVSVESGGVAHGSSGSSVTTAPSPAVVASEAESLGPVPAGASPLATAAFSVIALTLAAIFFVTMQGYDERQQMLPALLLPPLAALAILQLVRLLAALRLDRTILRPRVDAEQVQTDRVAITWFLALPALIFVLGVLPAVVIFIPLLRIFFYGQRPTVRSVMDGGLAAAGTAFIVWLLFVRVLDLRLYAGIL